RPRRAPARASPGARGRRSPLDRVVPVSLRGSGVSPQPSGTWGERITPAVRGSSPAVAASLGTTTTRRDSARPEHSTPLVAHVSPTTEAASGLAFRAPGTARIAGPHSRPPPRSEEEYHRNPRSRQKSRTALENRTQRSRTSEEYGNMEEAKRGSLA